MQTVDRTLKYSTEEKKNDFNQFHKLSKYFCECLEFLKYDNKTQVLSIFIFGWQCDEVHSNCDDICSDKIL